tara:strand:- start:494 stop:970 length:477 start_codon:yes stop_codon:yes gene_type:complete
MNKKQLYEECKRLLQDNMTLQLFQDDMCEKVLDRGAHIDILDKEIEKLKEENQDFKRDLETQIFFNNTLEEEIEYMKDHQMENTKLKEENQDFKREKLMLHNVCNEYKKENNKLTEEVLERDTHIDILDKEVEKMKEDYGKLQLEDFNNRINILFAKV